MPAPKRGSASPDLQPKIRKLDEDEEALSATIESTTNSFKTENMQENTAAAPRTKKKRLAVEQENSPDKSSNQSSPSKESSKTAPDPPVKKAKLLNATSASCGETPSQRTNSNISMKRTASTDSDEDLSSDSSKVDLFRERDDEDKAHCIRIYSNKIKAVCNAEESSSDPQELSQDLSSSPSDPVQKDHSYGRFSESTSLENTGEAEDKDSAESVTEEISRDETQEVPTDTLVSEIGSTKTSVTVEPATEKGKRVEIQYPESQTLMDNETPASSPDMSDCVMPVGEENEKQDETEFNKSQKYVDNTLTLPEKTLCAVTGELHSSDEGAQLVDERTDSACRSASQTHPITHFVSEENEQNVKSKTEEEEVSESTEICAEKLDGVLLNETNLAPEQVEISNIEGQPEKNVKMPEFVTTSNTQIDLGDQVASKEEFNATDIQAEMPGTLEKSEDKFEESARDGVDFQPPQTSACSEALVEVHLNHGIVTPDSCTDTLSECMVVQNQIEMLSDHFKVPEGQTPEVVLQSEENRLINVKATKVAAETERDSSDMSEEKDKSVQCSAAEIKGDAQTSHPDATVKTQNLDASESTTDFHEGCGGDSFKTLENEDTVDAESESEAETAVTPEISNSEPLVETQKQEIQEVSQSTTVTSSELHGSVAADKSENLKTVACAVLAEGQSGTETVAAFKLSDPAAKVELQIQDSPGNEHPAVVLDDGQESPENANSKSRNSVDITAENLIEVDIQTTAVSEEVCAQVEETHSLMNEEVSERTIDICATQSEIEFDIPVLPDAPSEEVSNIAHIEEVQTPESTTDQHDEAQKVLESANCVAQSQIEVVEDIQMALTSEKVSNIAHIEEVQTPTVRESTTDLHDEAQKVLESANCVSQSQIEVVEDVQAAVTLEKVSNIASIEEMQTPTVSESTTDLHDEAQKVLENANCVSQSQIEVVENVQAAVTLENVSNIASIEEIQTPMVSEPATDTPDDAYSDVEDAAFKSSKYVKCVSAIAQNEIEVDVDASALEKVSNVAPVKLSQMVSETTADTSVEVFGNHREEDLKTVANDEFKFESPAVTLNQMEVETTLSMESINSAPSLSVNKSQTEDDTQSPDNGSIIAFGVDTQTQKIQDVSGQTDNTDKELLEDKMVENVKQDDAVNSECEIVQEDQLESEMQITPDSVTSGASCSEERRKSQNEMDILTVTTSEQDCNIPAVEIKHLKSHDVNEENTDTQSVANEENLNKMETSFSPPSAETQNQRSFDITDSTDVSEQVQENFRTTTNESFENENKAIEESVPAALRANKMEMQAAEGLQENSQPTTTKQIESHRGQEVSELTTDINLSVSQTSSETPTQKSSDVTEPENEASVTVQERFEVPSDECHENENEVIKESVATAEWTNTMETQKAEMLEEVSQPTAPEQTQSQRGPEISELTTDSDISVLPPQPETQIQRSFDIADPASEASKTVQESFKIPSNECHENKATDEHVDDEMTNKMETQTAEMPKEGSPQTTTEETQSWRGQELSELTTDVSSPSTEIQMQESVNVESAVKVSETVQTIFSFTSNEVHNNDKFLERPVDTAEGTNEMETQVAEMSFEVSQPTNSETRQNLKGQEVSELTTDTNISVSPSSPETQIQMSSSVTDSANDASETVLESFRIPSNDHQENENNVIKECADTAERTHQMEIHAAELLEGSQPTITEQTESLRHQEVSGVSTDTDVCVSPASAETQVHISLDISEESTNKSESVQDVLRIPLNERHENVKNAVEEFADTAEMTNEMEIQTTEAVGEIFQPTASEQTQNPRGQEVRELTINTNISVSPPSAEAEMESRIVVTEPTSDLSKTTQENFIIPLNETNENEHEVIEKCVDTEKFVDTAEMINEMEVQTEAVVEIFQPATEQTQHQRADEVSELTTVTDLSVSPPSAETKIQKISITEPTDDFSTTNQENVKIPPNENEIEAIEECVLSAERTNEMETQPAKLLQEISQPTITEQSQNQSNQAVREHTTDTEVENNPINTESDKNINSVSTSENHPTITWQTSTPESYQKFDSELQHQKNEEDGQVHNIKDKDASECEDVPEAETNMEPSSESREISYSAAVEQQNHLSKETTEHTTDLSDEIQTPSPVVNLENKENGGQTEHENVQGDVISGSKERTESVLLEDIKIAESVSNTEEEEAKRHEVIVFVCDQSEDTDVAIQAPDEQIKMVNQSEVDFHENHVVYEPISSPESNSGGEVCTIQLGETISFLDLHSAETHQILGEGSNILTSDDKLKTTHPKLEDEEIVKKDICASDSQAVVLMEVETTSEAQCPAHAPSEQSNTTEDVEHVGAIGSSDISLADGQSQDAAEKSERSVILECISAAEVTEQVQEDTGVQDATGIVTTTTPAPTEVEITDVSSEDYVILEPVRVPESEVHFDIVTQAAAESGLSASLGPDEEMTSQSISSSAQQTEIPEAGAHQGETTDQVKETTVTSSGEVLEQQTEANCPQDAPVSDHLSPPAIVDVDSDHTNKDSNAAAMETVESVVNQEEVQILEDMEIGREIVVIEEDNDNDSDIVVITTPTDQPTEGSPKKSEEKVNDEKIQDTSKIAKTSAEKTEDEQSGQEVEKPKKQEMNMQARTKARLAALAEQKAAAAKRSANRQQLNLLALCQEIAEDIATDSMLLKKIEEEKQAAAAAAEAAKAEAVEKEHSAVISQEAEPDNLATPAGPEESSASVTPTPEPPAVQPSTADSVETKPAAEPPKRRFFISQISVPLKAHEKKKLTRYQRLRQVELQREKMSWARVKKLKSDQTSQMFSDVDWQASFSGSFLMGSTTPPPPAAASPSKTSSVIPATTTQPAQAKGGSPKVETSTSELVQTGADKAESIKTENIETELVKTEATKTEPTKTETSKTESTKAGTSKTEPTKTEPSKAEPVKAEATKTEAPVPENRRITRQSKAQASQATAAAPKPAPKVTRSSKRTLPAVPPPMPNGLNAQKQKPVEYKPYRPRPKYSFDDFELDDDDSLLVSQIKPNLPTQPPRPGLQPSHAKLPLKPTVSSQPANQAKLKPQAAPPGQVSTQSRPTAAAQAPPQSAKSKPTVTSTAQLKPTAAASSKPVPSTSSQLKTPILAASQSKPVSASAQPKPAASASPSSQTAGVNVTKQLATAVPQPASSAAAEAEPAAAAKADDASVPQKTENPLSQEKEKCKSTADPLSSLPASSLLSVESYDTKKSEESPADTTPNSSADHQSKTARTAEKTENRYQDEAKPQDAATFLSDASLQKEVNKLKEADKDGTQTIIDAGQKHFGPVACSGCGMLYSAANPEDEAQHLLFHNQFVSAVKYVGWKKERILSEYPDGKIILVLPDDPKYALKKVEEIREMVDNDLGFQQVETKCPSKTKTFLFISVDKKVAGCLIAEHIQEGYRVIEEPLPEGSEGEKVLFERQKAWCCSTTPEPAICGISRIWVASMMRRQGIATRMIECLRNNFIYGSYLRKDEIAFSDPTPDGKLFASHYFGTSQFLVYNFVSGPRSFQPKTQAV